MLEIREVSKSFGERLAMDAVSMMLPAGRLTGFVGSNGAGKTTTMRVVMGLLEPDSGTLEWDGAPLTAHQRRTFGYMPEERGLYPKQPVREQLSYFGRLHGMSRSATSARADELLQTFGLADRAKDRIEELSLGNQQRVQIAVALMHHPRALVLDEPFSGLDPEAVSAMAELIQSCARDGVPVLFSSHQLDLVERLCDQIVIISAGRVVAAGTATELRSGRPRVMRLDSPAVDALFPSGTELAGAPAVVPGVRVTRVEPGRLYFSPGQDGAENALLRTVLDRGPVSHFAEVVVPLSEIYREVVA